MADFKKDYYKILETISSATADEIKLAYRKQVKKYHPDLHPDYPEYGNLIKEINEAYEILGDKNERYAYDQYLANKKTKQKEEESANNPTKKNKRTYSKTTTVQIEERTYIKGEIFLKYFGKHDEKAAENILKETTYKITITETNAVIKNILGQELTQEFTDIFARFKPTSLKINQPVACEFVCEITGNYKLEIFSLTVPAPEIINVTQHEGESFGTITGLFYGYIKKVKTRDKTVIVEECFGETGKAERKVENDRNYSRKEYYNTDCSTYWGNWTTEILNKTNKETGKTQKDGNYSRSEYYFNDYKKTYWRNWTQTTKPSSTESGCLGSLGSILGICLGFLFCLFLLPNLAFLLPFILLPFLLNLFPVTFWNCVVKIVTILFCLIFVLALATKFLSVFHKKNQQAVVKEKPKVPRPKYITVRDSITKDEILDTLISHSMVWNDYEGKTYTGSFAVSKNSVNQAHFYKENLGIIADNENNYDKIIFSLKENDKQKLGGLYLMLDSIRRENKPNSIEFAEIIVSFVQNIPYTLVLPKACDARFYNDEFTAIYLASPDARCDGFEKYGINTPVEFMAYLNGDCDTRTLLLYTVLSRYGYDVALLSSQYYSHSILGINLPYEGQALQYNNQRYVFWETTVKNVKPGIISNEISNPNYWRISLKSK